MRSDDWLNSLYLHPGVVHSVDPSDPILDLMRRRAEAIGPVSNPCSPPGEGSIIVSHKKNLYRPCPRSASAPAKMPSPAGRQIREQMADYCTRSQR
jgi:hypothetical protein